MRRPYEFALTEDVFPVVKRSCTTAYVADTGVDYKLTQDYKIDGKRFEKDLVALSEVVFSVPLPDKATVFEFIGEYFDQDDNLILELNSKAEEKQQAEEAYEEAKANGFTAQLARKSKDNIFTMSLGALPDDCKRLRVSVSFSVGSQINSQAFMSGKIPIDLRFGTVPKQNIEGVVKVTDHVASAVWNQDTEFEAEVEINLSSPVTLIESPTHEISTKLFVEGNPGRAIVSLANNSSEQKKLMRVVVSSASLDKNSVFLQSKASVKNCSKSFEEVFGEDSVPGRISFALPDRKITLDKRRNFMFIVDRSGSMSGAPIENCKKALNLLLSSLPPDCKFNICSFGSHCSFLFPKKFESYSEESLKRARSLAGNMQATFGGTQLKNPIQGTIEMHESSLKDLKVGEKCETAVFLLTDGEVSNKQTIFDLVENAPQSKNASIKFYTLGIGNEVSVELVNKIAQLGNGNSVFIEKDERMNDKLAIQMESSFQEPFRNVKLEFSSPHLKPLEHKLVKDRKILESSTQLVGRKVSVPVMFSVSDQFQSLSEDEVLMLVTGEIDPEVGVEELVKITKKDVVEVENNLLVPYVQEEIDFIEKDKSAEQMKKSERQRVTELAVCANIPTDFTVLVAISPIQLNTAEKDPSKEKFMRVNQHHMYLKDTWNGMWQQHLPVDYVGLPIGTPLRPAIPAGPGGPGGGPQMLFGAAPLPAMMKMSRSSAGPPPAPKAGRAGMLEKKKKNKLTEKLPEAENALDLSYASSDEDDDIVFMKKEKASFAPPAFALEEEEEEEELAAFDGIKEKEGNPGATKAEFAVLDALVQFQSFDGSFEEADLIEILKLMSLPGKVGELKAAGKGTLTALVLVFLEEKLASLETEWKRIHLKAQTWLQQQQDINEVEAIQNARALL